MARLAERLAQIFSWACALAVPGLLLAFLGYLVMRGGPTLGPELLFGDVPADRVLFQGAPVFDGIWPAVLGTLWLVVLSTLMAAPVGVLAGAYLAEYASGRLKTALVFGVDVLAGIPSIIMGLFGFTLILFLRDAIDPQANVCLLLAAGCLALLVLPYLVNAARTSFESLPRSLRLTGESLGLTRNQIIFHILFPAASRGILGGLVLSIGRAAEDTAVILMTGAVAGAAAGPALFGKFAALPFQIYYLAAEHQNRQELDMAFGAALVLLSMTSVMFFAASLLRRSLEKRWTT